MRSDNLNPPTKFCNSQSFVSSRNIQTFELIMTIVINHRVLMVESSSTVFIMGTERHQSKYMMTLYYGQAYDWPITLHA